MISICMPIIHRPELSEMTEKAIRNIRETTKEQHEIILVQQGGEKEEFKDLVDKHLFFAKTLRSLGEAYNRGFEKADGDVFVNIHNDVTLPDNWDALLASAARKGYVGCVFTDETDSDCQSRGVHKGGLKYIPSCCFSISKENWEKISGYDEKFVGFHWEDLDLFLSAAQSGCDPVRCDVTVKHKRGVTRSIDGMFKSDYFMIANKDHYYQKHFDLFKDAGLYYINLPDYANFKEVAA